MAEMKQAWSAAAIPEMNFGPWSVRKFTIGERDFGNLRAKMEGRATRPGEYTQLLRNGQVVMSDTDAEYWDHYELFRHSGRENVRRVLIAGLGLACALRVVLSNPAIEQVDVVEIDAGVLSHVGAYVRDSRVRFHHASVDDIQWPAGTKWDVAWFDIWDDMCTDNLPHMERLARKYGRRAAWKGYWGKELTLRRQRMYA